MFTGLVEEVGRVHNIQKATKSARITILAQKVLEESKLGDSISVNGVCLTVTEFSKSTFSVDVMAETMRRSNLHQLTIGNSVNLERALRVGDRLGGHMVSGHIDGMGEIIDFTQEENAIWVTIRADADLLKYMVMKGSIAIDGISLTIALIKDNAFMVSIIPHTKEATTLLYKRAGESVNLECDMVGKYIERLLSYQNEGTEKKGIDLKFLTECGFMS